LTLAAAAAVDVLVGVFRLLPLLLRHDVS